MSSNWNMPWTSDKKCCVVFLNCHNIHVNNTLLTSLTESYSRYITPHVTDWIILTISHCSHHWLNHTHNKSSSSSSNRLFFLATTVAIGTVAGAILTTGLVMGLSFGFGLFLVTLRLRSKSSQSSNDSGKATFRLGNATFFGSAPFCHHTHTVLHNRVVDRIIHHKLQ